MSDPVNPLSDEPAADGDQVVPLARGLDMLRCFHSGDTVLGNQDLALRTGLPNSTVSRLTYTLSLLGYLHYVEEIGKYRLGLAVFGMGNGCLNSLVARRVAMPLMEELARSVGDNGLVGLGGKVGRKMVYVAAARGGGAVSLRLDVGSQLSMARSAMGRAYLAGLPAAERLSLLQQVRHDYDPRLWPRIEDGILRAVDEVRTQGFCLNVGEWVADVSSVGVPLPADPRGMEPALAFSFGGPSYHLSRDWLKNEIGPRLVEMARQVQSLRQK